MSTLPPGWQRVSAGITVMVAAAAGAPAYAQPGSGDLNGIFTATSNGDWAKTNDVYRDELSVRSTWHITTTCTAPTECAGHVESDAGWTAPIYRKNTMWYVKRTVPQWESCPDGATAEGVQTFRFYPVDENGQIPPQGSNIFAGEDKTIAPSGACGINQPLAISMPFKLVQAE
ncbi:hypothetical protein [Mycobacterium aquaticum]|uniref:Secreted protein n=1 Tax=Mycobacterium aquaticum TaxID=1927124 RepID=A0A1X0AWP4_9MYCO|nr:hypothetical protein [Mycobacterium aquaticum]ORA34494.1 hypothetical protein BST13_17320 [Mycobacterium aquaticum]